MVNLPWQETAQGVVLRVRVTPGARRETVEGLRELPEGPALVVRVAAPPVDGAANEAVAAVLAKALGLRRGAVTLLSGETARVKRLLLAGDRAAILARLAELCGGR